MHQSQVNVDSNDMRLWVCLVLLLFVSIWEETKSHNFSLSDEDGLDSKSGEGKDSEEGVGNSKSPEVDISSKPIDESKSKSDEDKSKSGEDSKPNSGEDKSKSGEDSKSKSGEDSNSKSGEDSKSKSGEDSKSKSGEDSKSKSGEDSKSKSGEDSKSKSGEDSKSKSVEDSRSKPDEDDDNPWEYDNHSSATSIFVPINLRRNPCVHSEFNSESRVYVETNKKLKNKIQCTLRYDPNMKKHYKDKNKKYIVEAFRVHCWRLAPGVLPTDTNLVSSVNDCSRYKPHFKPIVINVRMSPSQHTKDYDVLLYTRNSRFKADTYCTANQEPKTGIKVKGGKFLSAVYRTMCVRQSP
ncbi:protein transport protein SEC7-like [Colias croceus]|uniref:protein transport protein SEC7-like n=1 Tax=Colias crocea TaxID=72248 RepID=UPI001E27B375|nr:protein transport protein SEC7-like [Colias croceus]